MLVVVGANRSRATARVNAALPVSGTLRDLAFAEADAAAARLRGALAPFAVIPQLVNRSPASSACRAPSARGSAASSSPCSTARRRPGSPRC